MWNIISSAYTLASLLWDMLRWVKRQDWKKHIMDFYRWLCDYYPGVMLFGAMSSFVVAMLNIWM